MEAEVGVMQAPAKEDRRLLEAQKGKERCSREPSEGMPSYQHLGYRSVRLISQFGPSELPESTWAALSHCIWELLEWPPDPLMAPQRFPTMYSP